MASTRRSRSTANGRCGWSPAAAASLASSPVSQERSAGLSQLAEAGSRGSTHSTTGVISTAGTPVTTKIHCQPSRPATPCRSLSAPISGLPIRNEIGPASMNVPMAAARARLGNHRDR